MIEGIRLRLAQRDEAHRRVRLYVERLRKTVGPLTAVMIGSFARGDFHDGSDVDLVLISDAFPPGWKDRNELLYGISDGGMDLFGYTRDEFRRMLRTNHGTAYCAARDGKVIEDDGFWKEIREHAAL